MKIRNTIGLSLLFAAIVAPTFASAQRAVAPQTYRGGYGNGGYRQGYGYRNGAIGPIQLGGTTAYLSGGGYGYGYGPRVFYFQPPAFTYNGYFGYPQFDYGYRNYRYGTYRGYPVRIPR